jgi:hypothetical protein
MVLYNVFFRGSPNAKAQIGGAMSVSWKRGYSKSGWQCFVAAMLLVLAQLVASWHIPHDDPDGRVGGIECAIGSVAGNLSADVDAAPMATPSAGCTATVYLVSLSPVLFWGRSADRPGPRAPPAA